MLRTTMEQCSSSLASELSLPWLPRQTLREEQTSVPFGDRIWVHAQLSVCWTVPALKAATPWVPIPHASDVKQSWVVSLPLKSQVPLLILEYFIARCFLWLSPRCGSQEAAAVFGKTGSHRMVNILVYLMMLICWLRGTRVSSWCPSMLLPLYSVLSFKSSHGHHNNWEWKMTWTVGSMLMQTERSSPLAT